jgi:hypothetical protein
VRAQVKCCILMYDLEGGGELVTQLFATVMDAMK